MSTNDSPGILKDRLYPEKWWDRPDLDSRKIGDGPAETLYRAIGEAITHWTSVEDELGELLQSMCIDQETRIKDRYLGIVFGAIENVPNKVRAFKAAAAIRLSPYWGVPVVKKAVRRLLDEVEEASRRRNDIAHGKVVQVAGDVTTFEGDPFSGWKIKSQKHRGAELKFMLVAPDFATAKHIDGSSPYDESDPLTRFRSSYRMNAKDIICFGAKFQALAMELRKSRFLFESDFHSDEVILIRKLRCIYPKDFERRKPG